MTIQYEHLLGRTFKHGSDDCWGLLRHFYKDNFDIELRNYARPDFHWNHGLNIYLDNYYREGFRLLSPADEHPSQWRAGDMILMAVMSPVANHAAVILPNGNILHHSQGKLSIAEPLRPAYRNWIVGIVRHKDVVIPVERSTQDVMELLPNGIRSKIIAALPGKLECGESGPDPA